MYFLLSILLSVLFVIILLLIIVYVTSHTNEPSFYLGTDKVTCWYSRYGCCQDKITPKLDPDGTNCRWS